MLFFLNSWKRFVRTLRRQKKSRATFVVNLALLLRWKHAARFMAAQRRRPCVEGMWHHVNTQQARTASDSCLAQPTRAWGKAAAPREDKTGVSRPVMWCVIWRSHWSPSPHTSRLTYNTEPVNPFKYSFTEVNAAKWRKMHLSYDSWWKFENVSRNFIETQILFSSAGSDFQNANTPVGTELDRNKVTYTYFIVKCFLKISLIVSHCHVSIWEKILDLPVNQHPNPHLSQCNRPW